MGIDEDGQNRGCFCLFTFYFCLGSSSEFAGGEAGVGRAQIPEVLPEDFNLMDADLLAEHARAFAGSSTGDDAVAV